MKARIFAIAAYVVAMPFVYLTAAYGAAHLLYMPSLEMPRPRYWDLGSFGFGGHLAGGAAVVVITLLAYAFIFLTGDCDSDWENDTDDMFDPLNPVGFTNPMSVNNPLGVNNPLSPTNPVGINNPASPISPLNPTNFF